MSYAGYKEPDGSIRGDPMNLEITNICIQLGWNPPRTDFDILPLVLSANGNEYATFFKLQKLSILLNFNSNSPEYFEYPDNFVMEVPLSHPK